MAIKKSGSIPSSSPEELKNVLKTVASEWGDTIQDIEDFDVIQLKGAMTNEVFQINWPTIHGDLHQKVLVRIYGEGVDLFFNRDDEIRTFECMSKHGQGPRLLGRFPDGRIEEFIHARASNRGFWNKKPRTFPFHLSPLFSSYQTLSAADLRDPETSALIAAKLREFNNLDMPGSKDVLLWERLRTWLSHAKNFCSPEAAKEFGLNILGDEIDLLEKELVKDYQEIGFCHNDLQYGNIMMDEETRAITLIDYEYASYNPVAYDLANHFCEMAANYHTETPHILDYSIYPDMEERRRFIRAYLASLGNEPNDTEVEQLLTDAEKYTLANHLFWGLWGIISGHVNKIDFDYMEYARQRFQQYWFKKTLLLGS